MPIKQREVYTAKYYRHGNSFGMILPPDIREMMGLRVGDVIVCNFSHGILWAAKLTPGMIASRETVGKIFDSLFPDKEETHARK
jgi:hypothetical protein